MKKKHHKKDEDLLEQTEDLEKSTETALANNNSLDPKLFKKEEQLLLQALEEQTETINSIKADIESARITSTSNRNRNSSNPYTFLFNMYANLTSAQSSKMDIIKTMISVKKLKEELKLKFGKNSNEDEGFQAIANIILNNINNSLSPEDRAHIASGLANSKNDKDVIEEDAEEDEDELKELADQAADKLNYKTEKDLVEDDFSYVCTTSGIILKINKNWEVLEEIDESHEDFENFRIVRHKRTGEIISAMYLPTQTKLEMVEYE